MKNSNLILILLLLLLLIFIELFYTMNNLRYVTNDNKKMLGLENNIVLFADIGNSMYINGFDLYILDSWKIKKVHYNIMNEGNNEHMFYHAICKNYLWYYLIIFKIICHSIIAYLCLKDQKSKENLIV